MDNRINNVVVIESGRKRNVVINTKFRTKGYEVVEKKESLDSSITTSLTKEAATAILFGTAKHKRGQYDRATSTQLSAYGVTTGLRMHGASVIEGDRLDSGVIRRRKAH